MKIGLTTFYNYNYGSALQCFALQKHIEENYGSCDLLCPCVSSNRILRLAQSALRLTTKCLAHPLHARRILRGFLSTRSRSLKIQPESQLEIQRFIYLHLNKRSLHKREFRHIGSDYDLFLTGSDQVWNENMLSGHDLYFLRFAPKHKRAAYAPSFGGESITRYNQRLYRKYIREFEYLSAREESGRQIIKCLTDRTVPLLPDPVCLMDAAQWRNCIKENILYPNDLKTPNSPYILAFFIDSPSATSLEALSELQDQSGFQVCSFGYAHNAFDRLRNMRHADGSPWDFLRMIEHASLVVTDSFHASVFSVIFSTPFYTYRRNYQHSQDQSTRITNLLRKIELIDRFEPERPSFNSCFDCQAAHAYFAEQRGHTEHYFTSELKLKPRANKKVDSHIELFRHKSHCCGCGACAEICPKGAIAMELDEKGASYPRIEKDKCIRCEKCLRVCALKREQTPKTSYVQQAYVGFSLNRSLSEKSSSGGVFSMIASEILRQGGVVYGAAVCSEENRLCVQHIRINDVRDLHLIQGSKYTQSSTCGIFNQVKEDLETGIDVLFSGTSCQVAELKCFLGRVYSNLYTIDLVCHGVPGEGFFYSYLSFAERKYAMKISDISFRCKDPDSPFAITLVEKAAAGKERTKRISLHASSYLRFYMWQENYRESCYNCPYASMNKPADLTLGDFFADTQELDELSSQKKEILSFMMCNQEKGQLLLDKCENHLRKIRITREKAYASHTNLRRPSFPFKASARVVYEKKGFKGLSLYLFWRNVVVSILRFFHLIPQS